MKQETNQGSSGNFHRTNKRSREQATVILAIDWGESSTPRNINRDIVAVTEESVSVPISIVPAQSEGEKLSDV